MSHTPRTDGGLCKMAAAGAKSDGMDPASVQVLAKYFGPIQVGILVVILVAGWKMMGSGSKPSGFRNREGDKPRDKRAGGEALADAKLKRPVPPLQLPGLSLDGLPHEILGVRADASESEIHSAYRELMKRYHPDQVAAPGTRAWNDAQAIASALTNARDQLLAFRRAKRK
ncbi:MAG TPA: DnaJ domain-containing protein [Bdellovibrionota bacterium]|nr:DnaJ domain-containing protein [Bdellovibrionota bacterium]